MLKHIFCTIEDYTYSQMGKQEMQKYALTIV